MTFIARLVAMGGPQKGLAFDLKEQDVSIGRESSNDIEVLDLSVSRRHCLIRHMAGVWVLSSLPNTNGTRVNGIPIGERRLSDGDDISIGDTTFRFLVADPDPDPVPIDAGSLSLEVTTRIPLAELAESQLATREVQELLNFSRRLADANDIDSIHRRFVEGALHFTEAGRAAFVHPGRDGLATWNCSASCDVSGWRVNCFAISNTILREVSQSRSAVLVEDIRHSRILSDSLRSSGVCSLIALPAYVAGQLYGVLYVDSSTRQLTEDHLHWLGSSGAMVVVALENLLRIHSLKKENQELKAEKQLRHSLIGDATPMREVYQRIAKIAPSDATALIFGESGTGKELAARAIHENSPRSSRPFVAVNCALLNEALLESDLFGHEKGAFTGALQQKKGKFELAQGGTIFLDELGELSLPIQAKLLRVIQERQIERLGGTRPIAIDVRILGATHRDLEKAVAEKSFRHDLYFRLKVVTLLMPPLRERTADIPELALFLLQRCSERSRKRFHSIEPNAMRLLQSYSWPGNVRELENVIEHALVMGEGPILRAHDLPEALFEVESSTDETGVRFYSELNRAKQRIILEALDQARWNYTQAAASLGINRTYLHRLVRSLQITPPRSNEP
jgi:transcriptional regulator with GAF, ATPase, and Fis domain